MPQRLSELPSFRLHHVSKAVGQHVANLCEQGFAISRRQWRILSMLADGIARSPSDLAEQTSVDRGRMSRTIDALERRGFVARQSVAGDARRQLITLTPAGDRLFRTLFDEVRSVNMNLLAALDPADQEALHRILAVLEARLEIHRDARS